MGRGHVLEAAIYILRCADGSYYTGLTRRSVEERVSEHSAGVDPGCYTFRRRPVTLVFSAIFPRIDEAVAMERQVKGWSRAKKEALIEGRFEALPELARRRRSKQPTSFETRAVGRSSG
jgi:putative endonuclease